MNSPLAANDRVKVEVDGQIKELDVVDFVMADPYPAKNLVLAKILALLFRKSYPKLVKVYCPDGKIAYYELFEKLES